MSSGAGAASAGTRVALDARVLDIDDHQLGTVQPVGQRGGGDRGDRGGVGKHEADPSRRQRPGRPADTPPRFSAPPRSPRSPRRNATTAAPHTDPGPPRGRPTSAPTGSTPPRARDKSSSGPRRSAPPHRACARPGRPTTPESTPARVTGRVNTARLPHPASRACSSASSTSIDDSRRTGSAVMAANTRSNRSISVSMLFGVEHLGVEFDAKAQLGPRQGADRQRVVGVVAAGALGDGQLVGTQQHAGVDRVVLVHEKGVEESVRGRRCGGSSRSARCWCSSVWLWACCSWSSRSAVVVAGVIVARTGTVLINRPHHRFRAGQLGWSPRDRNAEGDIMLAGQPHQQLRPRALQHGVHGGVTAARQLTQGPRGGGGQPKRRDASLPQPQPILPADQCGGVEAGQHLAPDRVGGITSRSASQVTNLRYDPAAGSRCP